MDREEIIRMAREVADKDKVDPYLNEFVVLTPEELERFAALIAAEKKTEWVGLTNKDIDDCYFAARQPDFDIWAFAAEIEEVLKQKNAWGNHLV